MIKLGETIPLFLQIYDGKSNLDVEVIVYGPDGSVLFQDELLHAFGGLYRNNEFTMPDVAFVIAQYRVKNSKDYENSVDIFYRDNGETGVAQAVINSAKEMARQSQEKEAEFMVGKVVHISDDEFLEGKIT